MASNEARPAAFLRLTRRALSVGLGVAAVAGPWALMPGHAQEGVSSAPSQQVGRDDVPAHIAVVDGTVTLERDGQARAADINTVLLEGDRVRTDRGRVEILFGDGSALDLDEFTGVDLVSASLVRLRGGRLRIAIARLSNDVNYRIDGGGSSVEIHSAVDCQVSLTDAHSALELELAVFRGTAELSNTHGRSVVRAGYQASAVDDTAPSSAFAFNVTGDDFDQWVDAQRQTRVGTTSTQYLPDDVRPYSGVLDSAGTWDNDPTYGTVWYPQVSAGWQPYSDGYYSYVPVYGWCWVGATPWSWPTHHYGHWGQSSGRWFWKPDRGWSPAAAVSGARPQMPVTTAAPRATRSAAVPLRSPTNMRAQVAVSEIDPRAAASRPVPRRGTTLGSPTRTAVDPQPAVSSGMMRQAMPLSSPARPDAGTRSWSTGRTTAAPNTSATLSNRTMSPAAQAPQPLGSPAHALEARPQPAPANQPWRAIGAPARAGGPGASASAHAPTGTWGRATAAPSSGGRGRI